MTTDSVDAASAVPERYLTAAESGGLAAGFVGFLLLERGTLYLHDAPGRTNQSRERKLSGWLGTTDNRRSEARGLWRVTCVRDGRAGIVHLTGTERDTWLDEHGYGDLIP